MTIEKHAGNYYTATERVGKEYIVCRHETREGAIEGLLETLKERK